MRNVGYQVASGATRSEAIMSAMNDVKMFKILGEWDVKTVRKKQ